MQRKDGALVVDEIPTYPYDQEMNNSKNLALKTALLVDKIFRKKIKNYINNIITFSNDTEIFKIKTIQIENGVDLDKISPLNIKYDGKNMNIIAVAAIEYWQGYDRLIKALKNYYDAPNRRVNVTLHIVGDGSQLSYLKNMVREYNLSNYVIFYGFLSGRDLDKVYSKCQLAVAGLGIFRKNIIESKTLKVREYMARAIPFVYSSYDKSLKDLEYLFKVEDNETIFDINEILKFAQNIDYSNVKDLMRKYATDNYNWKIQMNKVMTKLNKEGKL